MILKSDSQSGLQYLRQATENGKGNAHQPSYSLYTVPVLAFQRIYELEISHLQMYSGTPVTQK